jgi:hypothetical protein
MLMRRTSVICAVTAAVTVVAGALGTGTAFAYGSADQPIAQVEISGNCNNPSFELCQEVGLGGVWAWAELDTAGSDGTHGDMDFTVAFCGHSGPGGGPHSAGGFGHPGEGEWWTANNLGDALAAGAFPFFDMSKTYDSYYVLDFFPGTGPDDFIAVVPTPYGHYSSPKSFPAGAQFQTQVAP